jgi:uncharacterized protein YjiS (DUF1127 family)
MEMIEAVLGARRSLWSMVTAFVDRTASDFAVWRQAQAERGRIVRELSSCSDRELADLGFSRSDIPAIANGTYRR